MNDLTDELILYYYSIYMDAAIEHYGLQELRARNDIHPDTLGWVLYEFLDGLQMKECIRLALRNDKIAQGIPLGVSAKVSPKKRSSDSSDEDKFQQPIGYKYEVNFPSFEGSKPKKGRQARGLQNGYGKEIFIANNANDLQYLREIKAKFKMLAGQVIQDVYNVVQSTELVENLLSLAFPKYYEKGATI